MVKPITSLSFVIPGAPRTKKNHGRRRYSFRKRRTLNIPSEAYENWAAHSHLALPSIRRAAEVAGIALPIRHELNCVAMFYREADTGGAVGYYQALADWLEASGVVANDRQIIRWWGSELLKDSAAPRIECRLELLWLREAAREGRK